MNNLIVFDLDGVITSEDAYWDTAGLVLHELLYSPHYWHIDPSVAGYQPVETAEENRRLSRLVLPEKVIVSLKSRSVNSNWDTCYAGFCMYLLYLLSLLPDVSSLLPLHPEKGEWIEAFRIQLAGLSKPVILDEQVFHALDNDLFEGYSGLDMLQRFNAYASEVLNTTVEGIFARYSPSWWFCERLFQEWYLGDTLFEKEYKQVAKQTGKPGCIHFEQPLLPVPRLRNTLKTLRQQHFTLGIATGRPRDEGLLPLENYGLLNYFDTRHITTHAEIALAEAALQAQGNTLSLVKPHPYQFLLASNPSYSHNAIIEMGKPFLVVGDTPGDVYGGHEAGAVVVAVKTGARTLQALARLEESEPDFLIEDMTALPALLVKMDSLATIQQMQFMEREKAE